MNWDSKARFRTKEIEYYEPIESTQLVTDQDIVLELTMNIGSDVDVVESGGYLMIFESLFELIDSKAPEKFFRQHLVSIVIGTTIAIIVIIVSVTMVANVRVPSHPERELDYRQSRFYRKN